MRPILLSFRPLLLAGAVALLSACGGDDPAAGSESTGTGTLTDSVVQGVTYLATPSGKSGKTTAEGKFDYVLGDTVVFRLGVLELGRVKPEGDNATVTPIELVGRPTGVDASTRANLVTNLLILLQSLDADGNPNNGIRIPDAASAALTLAVANTLGDALAGNPDDFDDGSINTALATLVAAAGGSAAIRSKEQALDHFKYQFMLQLPGSYVARQGDTVTTFRFDYDGDYLLGIAGPGLSGIERGRISWNPASGEITVVADSIDIDTNGTAGLNSLGGSIKLYFALDGDTLVIRSNQSDEPPTRMTRLGSSDTTLLGAFAAYQGDGSETSFNVPQFLFLGDGRYMLVDPKGDTNYTVPYATLCDGGPGIEYGHYSFSGGRLITSAIQVDTNGCAGLHDGETNGYAVLAPLTVSRSEGGVFLGDTPFMTYPRYQPRR